MTEKPENGKDKEVDSQKRPSLPESLEAAAKEAASKEPSEPKKNPQLDDTISRLLKKQAPAAGQEGDDSVH
jgi:hypothetical protein